MTVTVKNYFLSRKKSINKSDALLLSADDHDLPHI